MREEQILKEVKADIKMKNRETSSGQRLNAWYYTCNIQKCNFNFRNVLVIKYAIADDIMFNYFGLFPSRDQLSV